MYNTAPSASGLSFINLNRQVKYIVTNLVFNCTFIGNNASLKVAGAANVYTLYGLSDTMVSFKGCKFYNNSAPIYGGAIDITSLNFFENKEKAFPVEFINWLVTIIIYCNLLL